MSNIDQNIAEITTLNVGILGGPSVGKSIFAAKLFSSLKERDVRAELVREYAKELFWQRSFKLDNQIHIFGEQHERERSLQGQVDVMVTDAPIILNLHYSKDNEPLQRLVLAEAKKMKYVYFFLKRSGTYETVGRSQTEDESIHIDVSLKRLLAENDIDYVEIDKNDHRSALDLIIIRLKEIKNKI